MKESNNPLTNKRVITKRDIRKFKLYEKNKYAYRKMENIKKKICKVVFPVAFGMITIVGFNLLKVQAEPIDTKDNDSKMVANDISSKNVNDQDDTYDDLFHVGSSADKNKVIDFLYSSNGSYIYKYSKMYGVDPNIIACICMQESSLLHDECIPGGNLYNGYGVGLMQLESPSNQEITAYNYETKKMDTEYVTMENACNLEKNIKIGCMLFQNSLKANYGNILLAIQSHNYGQSMIDIILNSEYSNEDVNVKKDYSNIEFLKYIKNAHENPKNYLQNWNQETYGDSDYIANVLRYCPSSIVKYRYDKDEYTFNLKNLSVVNMEEFATKLR